MEYWVLFGSFAVLLVIGVPVAFSLGISSLAAVIYLGMPPLIVFQRMAAGMNVFALMAIPFFIYGGELMLHGAIAERLVRFAAGLLGHRKGGLGLVNVMASVFFGGVSGSAVADASAVGSIMIPQMEKRGYDKDYSVNITVTAAIIALMIPPSHNMIIYSISAGGTISIADLFTAGILPGLLLAILLMLAAYYVARRKGYPAEPFPGMSRVVQLFLNALPGLFLVLIIVGGVRSGIFTATESSMIAVIYALLVTLLAYRTLNWETFTKATIGAVKTTAMVLMVIGAASSFGWLLALMQVPQAMIVAMRAVSDNPYVIFLLLNVILLFLGCFMDMSPLIIICTPIFLPVVKAFGMDPVHFGVILILNLGIGLCTPPVGSVLFVGCAVGEIPLMKTVRTIWPFYGACFVTLMLVTYIPQISLFLPHLLAK
ncbi:conserved membrane hypothetical protein [uncultured Alphaproteobacteria bacterium]|uniref:TRAP transporter large permease protein n=1 Tax=uncultured Alphaproteobacteria bacterium TaxID=91750 RepID=A0A212JD29_9PROT|nr:conserved membrane hypothetical protein [uncultured Alphaproteobacteria bacterium]